MSNANRNMLGTVTHAWARDGFKARFAVCGPDARHTTRTRSEVTCKRCLASLAKRDRAFRRKARAGIKYTPVMYPPGVWPSRNAPTPEQHAKILLSGISAARAIAREEGRAL